MSQSKVVLVTGASSGIGRAAADLLVARGHHVFGTTRGAPQTATTGIELLSLDVRDEGSVSACVEEVLRRAGQIDVLSIICSTGRAA